MQLLEILFTLFISYTVCHYTLSSLGAPVWTDNRPAHYGWVVVGLSVLFAVLFVIFAGVFVASKVVA